METKNQLFSMWCSRFIYFCLFLYCQWQLVTSASYCTPVTFV